MQVVASTALEGQLRRGGGQLSAEAVRASGQWAALLRGLPSAGAGALAELLLDLRCCPSPSAPSPLRLTVAELPTWPPRTEVRVSSGQRTAALSVDDLKAALREPLVAALFEALLPTAVPALIEGLVYVDPPPRQQQRQDEDGGRPSSSSSSSMGDNTVERAPSSGPVAVPVTARWQNLRAAPNSSGGTGTGDSNQSTSTNADSLSHDSDHVDGDNIDDDHDDDDDDDDEYYDGDNVDDDRDLDEVEDDDGDDSEDGYDESSSSSDSDSSDEEMGVFNNTKTVDDYYVSTVRINCEELLSCLSSVYGHGRVVSLALPLVQARLRSADCRVLESAFQAVSTLTSNEDTAVLDPYMPELLAATVNAMRHAEPTDYAGLTPLHELIVEHEALGLASFKDDTQFQTWLLGAIKNHATVCTTAPTHAADAVARRLVPMLVARLDGISTIAATGVAAKNYDLFVCLTTVVDKLGATVEPYAVAIASNCLRLVQTPAKYKYRHVTTEPLHLLAAVIRALPHAVVPLLDGFPLVRLLVDDLGSDVRDGKTVLVMALVRFAFPFVEPLLPHLMQVLLAVPDDDPERLEAVGLVAPIWGEPFGAFVPRVLKFLLGALRKRRIEGGNFDYNSIDCAAISLGRVCLAACDRVAPLLDNESLTLCLSAMAMEVEASTALEGQLRRGGGQLSAEAVRASGQWAALLRGLPSAGAGALAELLLDLRCCPSPSAPSPLRLAVVELCSWPPRTEVRVSSGQRTAALSDDDLQAALREPLVAALFEALLPTVVPALIEGLVYVDPPPRQQQEEEKEGSPCSSGDSSMGDMDEEQPSNGPVAVPATADLPANSSGGTGTGDSNQSTNADSVSYDSDDGENVDDDHDHDDYEDDDGDDGYDDDESSSSSDSSDEEMGVANNTLRPLADQYVSTERVVFGSLLSFLSSVYGHGRIVSLALPLVQARLRSADWRVLESALFATYKLMTDEDTAVLDPYMPDLMAITVNSMHHAEPLDYAGLAPLHELIVQHEELGLASFEDDREFQTWLLGAISNHVTACTTAPVHSADAVARRLVPMLVARLEAISSFTFSAAAVNNYDLFMCLVTVVDKLGTVIEPYAEAIASNCLRLLQTPAESKCVQTELIMALARHALPFVEPLLPRLMEVLLAVPNEYERVEAVGLIAPIWGEPFRAFVPHVLEFLLGALSMKGTDTEYPHAVVRIAVPEEKLRCGV
eukprot:m51a1_g5873 hypothetical protein (1211) ;mRNA; r:454947-460346